MSICFIIINIQNISMEPPNSKLNLTVHLGQDSGQSTLAQVDVTNYVGDAEVTLPLLRLASSSRRQRSEESNLDSI